MRKGMSEVDGSWKEGRRGRRMKSRTGRLISSKSDKKWKAKTISRWMTNGASNWFSNVESFIMEKARKVGSNVKINKK